MRGKRTFIFVFVLILILTIHFTSDAAEEESLAQDEEVAAEEDSSILHYGGEVDFFSQYVWRGTKWSDGPVMQPSAWVSVYDVAFTLWGNFVLNDEANQGEFNEIDFILSYEAEFGNFRFEPVVQFWYYPNIPDSPSTGEASLKISYELGPIEIYTNNAFDIWRYRKSYYGEFGLAFEREFVDKLSFSVSSGFAWGDKKFNETYIGPSKNALNLFFINFAFIFKPVPFLSLSPNLSVSSLIDSELRAAVGSPDIAYGGIKIAAEF